MTDNVKLSEKIKLLPDAPGVYKMFDENGTVIYVGKAKVLKNRVRQYFRAHDAKDAYETKVANMVARIADFEYIITKNETEALTLEANLINVYQPKYNILLKDDKHFPYLRIDLRRDFPNFVIVRKVENDGAKYFGPYLSKFSLNEALTAIREYFPIRHCSKDLKKAIARRERPCLMHHIGKCCAPCSGEITREEYHALLKKVCNFLNGDSSEITDELKKKMQNASDELDFERAAIYRDRLSAIAALSEKQRATASKANCYDVFAIAMGDDDLAMCYALFVRDGRVVGTQHYAITVHGEAENVIMSSFIKQFYADSESVQKDILVSVSPDDDSIQPWLSEISGHTVRIHCPERGEKKALTDMARDNAVNELKKRNDLQMREWERGEGALTELCVAIGMETVPVRVECYDNSHLRGRDTVGAMIVFENGKPNNKEYRRFKIKAATDGDDYLAMREMLTRRFDRAKANDEKFNTLPDLIIVDGGRGQLNVALEVLDSFGLSHIPAIGLAEKNEEIILPDFTDPVVLDKHSAPLHLVQRIRDEAHRFAITYHRGMRSKSALYSVLDSIDGIGPKRKIALFDAFLTIDEMKAASYDAIKDVKGMNAPTAQKVYDFFHKADEAE